MCSRLDIAHPKRLPLPAPDGFELRETLLAGFPPDVAVLSAEIGGCACDLVWADPADAESAERARGQRKGWSASRIQRAMDARGHARARRHPERATFGRWLETAALTTPGVLVLVRDHGEPEPSTGDVTDVPVADFLRAPLAYRGGWVRLRV